MTVPAQIEAEIRRLFFVEHWKVGTIATQLGQHPDVVRRIVGLLSSHRVRPAPRPPLVAPFVPFLTETLERYPRLRATRLFDMIRERGYQGSTRTLRKFVATIRPRPRTEVFVRTEPLVGEQAQVDWAHVGSITVPGGRRALWAFVMVLSFSRAMWAELVLDLNVHSVRRSLVRSVEALGGCTRQWLFDNPRTIVLERVGDAVRFHPALLEVTGHYHVRPRLCAVRKPEQKGKVERAIRFLRDRFFAARTIYTLQQGNAQLQTWIEQVAHARPHPVRREHTVGAWLEQERARLLPLPSVPLSTDQVLPVLVDKTASVRFDTNVYSVPPEHAGTTRTLAADQQTVRILDGAHVVAVHPRCWGRGQSIEDPVHRAAIVQYKRGAQDLKGRDRLRAIVPEIDRLLQQWVDQDHYLGCLIGRTVKLLNAYGETVFVEAVTELLARGAHDLGALAVLCEQRRRAHQRPIPIDLVLGTHVPEREVIPHALEGYDGQR